MATIPIVLGLLMQVGLAQQNFARQMRIEQIVEDYRWVASEEGGFNSSLAYGFRSDLSKASGMPENSVSLQLDAPKAAGSGDISYRIEIYGFKLVAANRLFGIKDTENSSAYVIAGSVPNRKQDIKEPEPLAEDE